LLLAALGNISFLFCRIVFGVLQVSAMFCLWGTQYLDSVPWCQLWNWNVCWRRHPALLVWLYSKRRLTEGCCASVLTVTARYVIRMAQKISHYW